MVDVLTSKQLAMIGRVGGLLEGAGLAYWLFGGWAVDFYAGSVTRPHDDVDLAIWLDDLPRIEQLLTEDGWRHAPDPDQDGGTGFERDGVRLELTFLVRDAEGVFIPMRNGRASWPEESLADDVRELNGVRARLMALSTLTAWKAAARDEPDEAAKDRADFERLSELGA